jgi:hypothetical protein
MPMAASSAYITFEPWGAAQRCVFADNHTRDRKAIIRCQLACQVVWSHIFNQCGQQLAFVCV